MKLLQTGLQEFETAAELEKFINENEKVVIVCGRMGPMCVPVYGIMESLRDSGRHDDIRFYDMLFDSPESLLLLHHMI